MRFILHRVCISGSGLPRAPAVARALDTDLDMEDRVCVAILVPRDQRTQHTRGPSASPLRRVRARVRPW